MIGTKPWDRLIDEGETDAHYTLFCQYLNLPKRGADPRRYANDLAELAGKTPGWISQLQKRWRWEERAKAYDEHLVLDPQMLAVRDERKQVAVEMREMAKELRDKTRDAIDKMDAKSIRPEDLPRLMRLSMLLDDKAEQIESPEYEKRKEDAKRQIRGLLEGLFTSQLGGDASGEPGVVVEATERTVRITGDSGRGQRPVEAVVEVPGRVCDGVLRLPPGTGPGEDSVRGEGPHPSGGEVGPLDGQD